MHLRRSNCDERLGIGCKFVRGAKNAIFHTDKFAVYYEVLPYQQHMSHVKQSNFTAHLERFNDTLRQRYARLARKNLLFLKEAPLLNHHN